MKVLLDSFHLNGHTPGTLEFHPQAKSYNHLLQYNKQYYMNVLVTHTIPRDGAVERDGLEGEAQTGWG